MLERVPINFSISKRNLKKIDFVFKIKFQKISCQKMYEGCLIRCKRNSIQNKVYYGLHQRYIAQSIYIRGDARHFTLVNAWASTMDPLRGSITST